MTGYLEDLPGYRDVLNNTTLMARRAKLRFVGATVSDDPTNGATLVTISGTGLPGGSDTQVQYNGSGVFAGHADFVWSAAAKTLTVGVATGGRVRVVGDGTLPPLVAENVGGDSKQVAQFKQTGTNGGLADIFVGDRDPTGAVSALVGSLYVRADTGTPANSNIYLNQSGATTWTPLIGGAAGVTSIYDLIVDTGQATDTAKSRFATLLEATTAANALKGIKRIHIADVTLVAPAATYDFTDIELLGTKVTGSRTQLTFVPSTTTWTAPPKAFRNIDVVSSGSTGALYTAAAGENYTIEVDDSLLSTTTPRVFFNISGQSMTINTRNGARVTGSGVIGWNATSTLVVNAYDRSDWSSFTPQGGAAGTSFTINLSSGSMMKSEPYAGGYVPIINRLDSVDPVNVTASSGAFKARMNTRYEVNADAPLTITLPDPGSGTNPVGGEGQVIEVVDRLGTAHTNNITVTYPNNINGTTTFVMNRQYQTVVLVPSDTSIGLKQWRVQSDQSPSPVEATFVINSTNAKNTFTDVAAARRVSEGYPGRKVLRWETNETISATYNWVEYGICGASKANSVTFNGVSFQSGFTPDMSSITFVKDGANVMTNFENTRAPVFRDVSLTLAASAASSFAEVSQIGLHINFTDCDLSGSATQPLIEVLTGVTFTVHLFGRCTVAANTFGGAGTINVVVHDARTTVATQTVHAPPLINISQSRIAIEKRVLVDTTTTSLVFVNLLTQVVTVPHAGDYALTFNASGSHSTNDKMVSFRILVDAAQVAACGTRMRIVSDSGSCGTSTIQRLADGAHTITVEWKTESNTAQIFPVTQPDNESAILTVIQL